MIRALAHLALAVFLTGLTQIGGLAFGFSLLFRRRLLAFAALYLGALLGAWQIAPLFGRAPLSCFGGPLRSAVYSCALARNYAKPAMLDALQDAAEAMPSGTITLALDLNFPFFNGFPLPPHLSHDDGEKADLAFYYMREGVYLAGKTRSPIGYFAYESGPSACGAPHESLSLWPDYALDAARTRSLIAHLSADARITKIFIEPHLAQRLDLSGPKIRFQGCHAARHDDHIHLQL